MPKCLLRVVLTLLAFVALGATLVQARSLTLDERIAAQEAIERVYYSYQVGAKKRFEEAVPPEVLRRKVVRYLKQSKALEQIWHTPVTAEMLEHELQRMIAGSQMPGRLQELFAALDHDSFLIQECLARATLVDRLTRNFQASDEPPWESWWSTVSPQLDESQVATAADPGVPVQIGTLDGICATDETWDNGALDDAPMPQYAHTAVWTGSRMLVWGGCERSPCDSSGQQLRTGHQYDPATDSWAPISTTGAPSARYEHTAIWTGSRMVIWGGDDGRFLDTGGRYDPLTDSWAVTTTVGVPSARFGHTAVWTGSEMLIWGGEHNQSEPYAGGRYDPVADRWVLISNANAPSRRVHHSAIWTGSEMIIWGATADLSGGVYYPATDSWLGTSPIGAPSVRSRHTAIWTGDRMLIWGGSDTNTGGLYDPVTETWTPTSTEDAPLPRWYHTGVWTGSEMLVWGGQDNSGNLNTGAWFELFYEHWWPFSMVDAPSPRREFSAVWTGSHMIVWGGLDHYELDNGGRYAMGHMDDGDGDGLSECDGDCNDDNPWIYPDALEVCDGFDNQCPGDPGYGVIDETSGNCGFNNPNDKSEYSWPAQPGAVQYEVVRSDRPDFYSDCTFLTTTETAIVAEDPEVGETHFYLTRPVAPLIGSWGQDSSLQERFPPCASGVTSINFQPDRSALPAWHQKDWGQAFDEELGYGWSVPITGNTRERDLLEEQYLDTFVFSQVVREWNLALPVGTYAINFVSGDAAYAQGPQQVVVEGITAMDGVTMPAGEFWAISVCADVGDGHVTIEIGGQAGNTILNSMFVEPDSCAPGTVIVQGIFTP